MIVIGLTGSMGSGKSVVASLLRDANVPVIDADELARRITTEPSPVLEQIRARFGTSVFNADQSLNRKALAEIVFQDKKALADLESITHPAIEALRQKELEKLAKSHKVAVYMAPLLIEKNLSQGIDKTILVVASEELMLKRIHLRDGLNEHEARLRLNAQLSTQEKMKRADAIIENNGTVEELFMQLKIIWPRLCKMELSKT